jgi:putative phosphoserine phosphatase / 1-acylglycerol-3-phosphate O-acyltransferase
MTAVPELVAQIESGPRGPAVGALFDLDGTLVSGYTAGAFYRERARRGQIGPVELARSLAIVADSALLGGDASRLGDVAVGALRGRPRAELEQMGEQIHTKLASSIRPAMRELVAAHRRRGHTIAAASSATRFQVDPIARELGIEHVLCSEVAVEDGALTGAFADGGMLWGERKAAAARAFARDRGLDLRRTYAYADGDEDIAFLASVGRPHAVSPGPLLERAADTEGWPVVRLGEPDGAGPRSLLGTVAAAAGLNVAAGLGLAVGALRRDRRAGANLAAGRSCEVALRLAGVRLRVTGAENLERERPAVFVFNHQSNLDPIVVGALLGHDYTATGKKEARLDPVAALSGLLLDAVFLDRSDTGSAKRRMGEVVERLRAGESVMIAPEGTRSPGPVPAPFKHGAFHAAAQARVPVVPIVLRNAGELMPPGSKAIRPGILDVCVLEPIAVRGQVGARARAVRDLVATTLERWPEEEEEWA